MVQIQQIHDDVTALSTLHPIPQVGVLAINSFVLDAEQQLIVDTGTTGDSDKMCAALESTVDPDRLRWLWITHTDADHIGSVHRLLDLYPQLRVVTTFTGWVKMGTHAPIPPARVQLLNPGESLDLGDRVIQAFAPPLFDAPETTGFFDPVSRALLSSDCFGAILPDNVSSVSELSPEELRVAQTLWTSIDTPWASKIDRVMLEVELDAIRALDPAMILSAHLPPTPGIVDQQLDGVRAAPDTEPFVGIDQTTLDTWLQK
jgi:flavorubredoxin